MTTYNKPGEDLTLYTVVQSHLEKKYPKVSEKWRVQMNNLHILPFALIQKASYVLKDLLEAILAEEGNCKPSGCLQTNVDYQKFLIGETRNQKKDHETEYVKAHCLINSPNDPVYLLCFVQNAIATITVQLPTLRSIRRFVKGVKSIFGDSFWKEIDQTRVIDRDGKSIITLQLHNRRRFFEESTKKSNDKQTNNKKPNNKQVENKQVEIKKPNNKQVK